MNKKDIIEKVLKELDNAYKKFPFWPNDPLHALAVVNEEIGELQKEVLQMCYEPHKTNKELIKLEAIQSTAMLLRFLIGLDEYSYKEGEQYKQQLD